MLKFLTIALLAYLLYRFTVKPKQLANRKNDSLQEKDTEEYTEYEEME